MEGCYAYTCDDHSDSFLNQFIFWILLGRKKIFHMNRQKIENQLKKTLIHTRKHPGRLKTILQISLRGFIWATGLTFLMSLGWLTLMPKTTDMDGFNHIVMMIFIVPGCFVATFALTLLVYTIKHFYTKRKALRRN